MTIVNRKYNNKLKENSRELRKNMTDEEKHLWYDFLRYSSARFVRQKVIGDYIVDFYCSKAMLVIEIDGSQHFETEAIEYDNERTNYLNKRNLEVLRFTNLDINTNFIGVCEYIDSIVSERLKK